MAKVIGFDPVDLGFGGMINYSGSDNNKVLDDVKDGDYPIAPAPPVSYAGRTYSYTTRFDTLGDGSGLHIYNGTTYYARLVNRWAVSGTNADVWISTVTPYSGTGEGKYLFSVNGSRYAKYDIDTDTEVQIWPTGTLKDATGTNIDAYSSDFMLTASPFGVPTGFFTNAYDYKVYIYDLTGTPTLIKTIDMAALATGIPAPSGSRYLGGLAVDPAGNVFCIVMGIGVTSTLYGVDPVNEVAVDNITFAGFSSGLYSARSVDFDENTGDLWICDSAYDKAFKYVNS